MSGGTSGVSSKTIIKMNQIRITENISPRGETFWEVDIDMPGGTKEFHVFDSKRNAEDFTKGFRVGTHFALSAIQTLNPSKNIVTNP